MTPGRHDFAARYGPWALVAGASEGLGSAFARAIATRGVNTVLLARRQAVLDEVAAKLPTQTRTLAVDLSHDDAMGRIAAATDDLDIGLVVYCAGGDTSYDEFLARPVDDALDMVRRNCVVPVRMCHHFATPMVERGRGGIVLVGSGAGLVGAPHNATYSATKAFDMVLAEALWSELHDRGVDVLGLILGLTDTPSLRRVLARRGQLVSADSDEPIPGADAADDVAEQAMANLAYGPTYFVGDMLRDGARQLGALSRNDAVHLMTQMATSTMGGAR